LYIHLLSVRSSKKKLNVSGMLTCIRSTVTPNALVRQELFTTKTNTTLTPDHSKKKSRAISRCLDLKQTSPRDFSVQNVYIGRNIARRQVQLNRDNERDYSGSNHSTLPREDSKLGKWCKQIPIVEPMVLPQLYV
jgi:hypothetical protein